MIITWTCEFCGWANDNNDGPCRKCGGHTESRLINKKWRTVTIKKPDRAALEAALTDAGDKNAVNP